MVLMIMWGAGLLIRRNTIDKEKVILGTQGDPM